MYTRIHIKRKINFMKIPRYSMGEKKNNNANVIS